MAHSLIVAIDTETSLIKPGVLAPPLACVSFAYFDTLRKDYANGILHHTTAIRDVRTWLEGAANFNDVMIVGHNIAYDLAVLGSHDPSLLPLIFAALERGNIDDTLIREQLINIEDGTFWQRRTKRGAYSLLGLVEKYLPDFGMSKGEDTYRLKYGALISEPLREWPEEAIDYARKDALATLLVFRKQGENVTNSREQTRAAFALHLMSCWGVVTDPGKVSEFVEGIEDVMSAHREKLTLSGLMRADGTKDTARIKERVKSSAKAARREVKLTGKGNVSMDEETLSGTGDPDLALLVEFTKAQKLDSVWKRFLQQGANPSTPVQARFHCLVETGRTSCSGPNLQNPHRAAGLRECFVPRRGYLFAACDYSTLELCTLAQVTTWLFGGSVMADKLREGVDLHLHFAAQILGISYEEALKRQKEKDPEIKQTRQTAKAANFGYPGGMGANSFRSFAKGYGLNLSEKQAGKLKEDWFLAWPEMRDYFRFIHTTIGDEIGTIEQFVSKRKRGGVRFTQACNSMFQGLAADGAKEALFEVSRRCYTEPESALYGSRPVMFIHDEIVLESPQDLASKAADELALVMRERMSRFTPDIPIKTTVAIMDRWYKEADETRNERGELQIWRAENG